MSVLSIVFPGTSNDIRPGAEIGVCFERGGRIAASREVAASARGDGAVELEYTDTLSQVVTMYKDEKTNQFQVLYVVLACTPELMLRICS